MSRRTISVNVHVDEYVDAEVDLADIDEKDLMGELESRNARIPEIVSRTKVESLYYATRPGSQLTARLAEEIHDLLALMYGRYA